MNPNLIAKAIIKLGKDRALMREMGEIGYNRAVNYYRDDTFLDEYEKLYRSVIK